LKKSYKYKYGPNCTYEALVDKITEVEAPIHQELLMKKVADYLGYGRLGRKIREDISTAIKNVKNEEMVSRKGKFIYHVYSDIKIRNRSSMPSEYRDIENIAPEEIQKALL